MLAKVDGATLYGIEAIAVQVEVDIAGGLPGFAMVGLPESTVKEARVRVQAAIENSGFVFPEGRITVNLAPAHIRKEGTGFDLPIALGILAAAGQIPEVMLKTALISGELSLGGDIKPIRGALAIGELAAKTGKKMLMVPTANGAEAAAVQEIVVRCAANFRDAADYFFSGDDQLAPQAEEVKNPPHVFDCDMADVCGQRLAKRALEIAAAGGHNLLMIGGPGSGKTMMARRLASILPPMERKEALEATRIHSVTGLTMGSGLLTTRPFRAPHHSTTCAGLIGGGHGIPRPGEISVATHGVLFLDELPEFPKNVLEAMRQPLESGEVVICRANGTVSYPCKPMFIAAMNPCPCGNFGCHRRVCRCSSIEVSRYRAKISGPLLDRIDIHIEVPPVDLKLLQAKNQEEPSEKIRERVCKARDLQQKRLGDGCINATMSRKQLMATSLPGEEGQKLLLTAIERLGMSARAHDRILRVARTIADLSDSKKVETSFIAEALQYRGDDRMLLAA